MRTLISPPFEGLEELPEFTFETEHSKIENNETFRVLRTSEY